MTEQICTLLSDAGLTVNESVIRSLIDRHPDRDALAAAETAATWAMDPAVRTRNGTSLFRAALERGPRIIPTSEADAAATAWAELTPLLEAEVSEFNFHIWFKPLRAAGYRPGALTIAAPAHVCGWVRERYGDLLHAKAAEAFGQATTVELVLADTEAAA